MERTLDVADPEIKKPPQGGIFRGRIEMLPDEALKPVGIIGQMVDDLRCRQPIFAALQCEVAHRCSPTVCPIRPARVPPEVLLGNEKMRDTSSLAASIRGCCQTCGAALLKGSRKGLDRGWRESVREKFGWP